MGLGHSALLDAGLLLATVLRPTKCSSCLGSWMQLAANLQAFSMTMSTSLMLQPMSSTGSDALIMQVRQQPYMDRALNPAWPCVGQCSHSLRHGSLSVLLCMGVL